MICDDLGEAALQYVDLGLKILPLMPGTKVPMIKHGVLAATDDRDQVKRFWTRNPEANIGIATGHLVDVIDLDGWEGQASFDLIKSKPTIIGTVATVRDGGLHHYIVASGKGNRAKMLMGMDFRGLGGYVVAPPSKIVPTDDQDAQGLYKWLSDLDLGRATQPDLGWWLEVEPEQTEREIMHRPVDVPDHVEALKNYMISAINQEMRRVYESQPGQRNHNLNVAAFNLGQLAAYLDEIETKGALRQAAITVGLREPEITKTINSGWLAGSRQPRTPALKEKGWSVTFDDQDDWTSDLSDHAEIATSGDHAGFWMMRPELDHIRRYALARTVSPWALLGAVIMRVLTSVPPWVTLPPIVGSKGSLNSYLCIVGASGDGKNAVVGVADEAVIIKHHDHVYRPRVMSLGTGEGMLSKYAHIEKIDKTFVQQDEDDMRILWINMEVQLIKALTARSGSVMMELLKDAWSGESIGMTYHNKGAGSVTLARHSYRLCMIIGAQPENVETLLDDAIGGFPQRLLWLPATDPDITEDPEPAPDPMIIEHDWPGGHITIPVPQEIWAIIRHERVARTRGENLGDLEGHQRYLQLKIAAAYMIMNGRRMMIMEDWDLAEITITMSKATRDSARRKIKAKHDRERDAAHHDAARQAVVVDTARQDHAEKRDHDQVRQTIVRHLASGPLKRRELQRFVGNRRREIFVAVLEDLMSRGVVITEEMIMPSGRRAVMLRLA